MNRQKNVRVETAKGRKISSTNWLRRQLNDSYTQSAKQEGYRSRAAYKLLEIEEKFSILREKNTILDLGSSPGSWSQIASVYCNQVIALDLIDMKKIDNVEFIQCDFTHMDSKTKGMLSTKEIDLILSDMSPSTCGNRVIDHLRMVILVQEVLKFLRSTMKIGGDLVIKIFHGSEEKELYSEFTKLFKRVKYYKPKASRQNSSEIYLIAKHFSL